ncbi:MAG TPA: DsbA family protein [Solirubrobacteraceae bacterium]|nr:DsbA family protein [Solirubrobacteraceae bacterium]
MGDVISLAERRAARVDRSGRAGPEGHSAREHAAGARGRSRVTFYFDLASPWTYLAAERVDRLCCEVRWRPVMSEGLPNLGPADGGRGPAEDRAAELRLPLVWPERWPGAVPAAMRVAAMAAERGQAAPFVLAAGRLAFCGGYDLEDPEILAEAAAAAGLPLEECLAAAGGFGRDGALERAALRLLALGADALPALRVARRLFCGEHRLAEAIAAAGLPLQRRWA